MARTIGAAVEPAIDADLKVPAVPIIVPPREEFALRGVRFACVVPGRPQTTMTRVVPAVAVLGVGADGQAEPMVAVDAATNASVTSKAYALATSELVAAGVAAFAWLLT